RRRVRSLAFSVPHFAHFVSTRFPCRSMLEISTTATRWPPHSAGAMVEAVSVAWNTCVPALSKAHGCPSLSSVPSTYGAPQLEHTSSGSRGHSAPSAAGKSSRRPHAHSAPRHLSADEDRRTLRGGPSRRRAF